MSQVVNIIAVTIVVIIAVTIVVIISSFHSLVGYSPWGCRESDTT